MPAHYDLEEVKRLVAADLDDPSSEKVVFTAKSRSIDSVIQVHRNKSGKRMTSEKAAEFILYRLLELQPSNFYSRKTGQWGDPTLVVDQYGLEFDGVPYFIKFRIDQGAGEPQLDEISFHPAEFDMILANGTVLKAKVV